MLAQANWPGVGPGAQLLAQQGELQTQAVQFGFFLAAADAFAAANLVGKAAPLASLQAQCLQAQAMGIGQLTQTRLGGAA